MGYPKQNSVADRLQTVSMDALEAVQDNHWKAIERAWESARRDLRAHVVDTYHHYFGSGNWSLIGLRTTGAWHVLDQGLRARIGSFRDQSRQLAKDGINSTYRESILRHAWVIDQTTPPNVKVRIPHRLKLMEAARAVSFYKGDEAVAKFADRWNTWSDAYSSALMRNLQLGSLNESSASDAASEVDATRVNTPQYGLLDALQRIFDFETMSAINRAIETVGEVNEEAEVQMIWETRRDMKVCDDCDANEGLTEAEVDDFIPMHPNCHCYWRIVPKTWAELLRSGSDEDYKLAVLMDARGIVPNAMVIKDAYGDLAGYTTVDFEEWAGENVHAVVAR